MANDINAGKAYVKTYLDNSELPKGIAAAQSKLAAFGQSLSMIGKVAGALGGSILAPLALLEAKMGGKMSNSVRLLMQTFGDLGTAILKAAGRLSNVLGPSTEKAVGAITAMVSKLTTWIEKNPQVIQQIVRIGMALTVAGAALYGFGAALPIIGTALVVILSPLGLVVTAVTAAGALWYFGRNTQTFAALRSGVMDFASGAAEAFNTVKTDATSAFDGILAALRAGDLAAAWNVVTATFRLEWARLVEWFYTSKFGQSILDGITNIRLAWVELTAFFRTAWANAIADISSRWEEWKTSFATEWAASNVFAPIFAMLYGVDVKDVQQNLAEDMAAARKQTPKRLNEIEADRQAAIAAANAGRESGRAGITGAGATTESPVNRAAEALREAIAARDRAVGAANKLKPTELPKLRTDKELAGSIGTFSGTAAAGMATGSHAARTAKNTDDLKRIIQEWSKDAADTSRRFATSLAKISLQASE